VTTTPLRAIAPRLPASLLYSGDYNPEQWPEEIWAEDMALMRRAGVNLVSLGIFSWARLEPRRDHFDFSWLGRIVALLAQNDISICLATATAGRGSAGTLCGRVPGRAACADLAPVRPRLGRLYWHGSRAWPFPGNPGRGLCGKAGLPADCRPARRGAVGAPRRGDGVPVCDQSHGRALHAGIWGMVRSRSAHRRGLRGTGDDRTARRPDHQPSVSRATCHDKIGHGPVATRLAPDPACGY
jgi:hypothetical protein